MQQMFPEIRPYAEHRLMVQAPHNLYICESGSPEGIPVLIIHGGPGAGMSEHARRFFDPDVFRIIQYDQRGCGRSTPHACLDNNHLDALKSDIETLRQYLQIDQWLLFGGSWGVTLALAYAQDYPDSVLGFMLRGAFLARTKDIDWLYKEGASRIFPEFWESFTDMVGGENGTPLIDAYYQLLSGTNELKRMGAAKSWTGWEGHCLTLTPDPKTQTSFSDPSFALGMASIGIHFMRHGCFLQENQILDNMDRIKHLPAIIIHGRYDMVCPLDNAYDLYRRWPEAELDVVREAGHSQYENGIVDATIKAAWTMAKRLGHDPMQA
ncbi:prolyl aminopeptidase [Gynuella sp.]|uniref:prolyl aminopeptidase n=1 Tax=Gynuella sp. TaxID=2969146 RepID=UPI003D13F827